MYLPTIYIYKCTLSDNVTVIAKFLLVRTHGQLQSQQVRNQTDIYLSGMGLYGIIFIYIDNNFDI